MMMHPAARLAAALAHGADEPTDAELLTRFAADRDAGAFELLVWRHAGLVLRVCRRVLRDHHAAEDATQAVFLALARQAASVGRSGSAAGWLFQVARRVAARAARRRTVRTVSEADLDTLPAPDTDSAPDIDAERVLQEELARLPEPYRSPVLLCFFEGLTYAEAARRLGVPVGTVAGRMARAKDTLASRLTRRGMPLSLLTPVAIAVGPSFAAATTRAGVAFATRSCSGAPAPVLALAKRELHMTVVKKMFGGGIALAAVCGCLALGLRSSAEPPAPPPAPVPAPVPAAKAPVQKPPAPVIGEAFAIAPVTTDLQRRLIYGAGPNSTALLIVDAPALFKDAKTLDIEALQLSELRTGLKTFRPDKGKSLVHFEVHYADLKAPSKDSKEVLDFTLEGAARAEGFLPGTPTGFHSYSPTSPGSFAFDQHIAPLKDNKGAEDAEVGVGDERARAYPVRTPLSRMLTGSVAGVVVVRPPLTCEADDWLPADVDLSVKAAIGKLKLAKGQRLDFLFNIPKRDERVQDRVRGACKRWAEDGGLELGSFGY
jgi:RNA polymerase sigma factor (sigma-70 family)